jgi:stalled ribosome rescue protein Dom34
MPLFYAVVWLDHQRAQVLQFDAAHVQAQKIKTHTHHIRQHGSLVRTEHEYFSEVCDALVGVHEVLVTGSHTPQVDFKHFAEKHRPQVAALIAGYETVDHPSERQLLALARKYFVRFDRMVGQPTLG